MEVTNDTAIRRRRKFTSHAQNDKHRLLAEMSSATDGAGDDTEDRQLIRKSRRLTKAIILRGWTDEYRSAFVAVCSTVTLGVVLWHFDHKLSPSFGPRLDLDTIVIVVMTVLRVTLGSIVESCLAQAAWVWASKSHQLRKNNIFRLEDFKLFDEASRGFWGSLALIWRLRGLLLRHLACIGAATIMISHSFETLSQQMFVVVQRPTPYTDDVVSPAPEPPRSDYWDNVVQKGDANDCVLTLSTKSAIYSGILSVDIADLEPTCFTANCTWPIFPTLGVCGECSAVKVQFICAEDSHTCIFTTQSNQNLTIPVGTETESFKVQPLNDRREDELGYHKTVIANFEMMTVSNHTSGTRSKAYQCSLWFCVKFFEVSVEDGRSNQTIVETHHDTRLEPSDHFLTDEHVFVHLSSAPLYDEPQVSVYSMSDRSVKAIRSFMDALTLGYFQLPPSAISFPSDWIEAMWRATADIDSWIDRISQSLTNEIRLHGSLRDPHGAKYSGRASTLAGFVHVQWYWMIYPPVVLAISLGFLASIIVASVRYEIMPWKGDCLPLLFCQTDDSLLSNAGQCMNSRHRIQDILKRRVALTQDENGAWAFESVEVEK